MFIFSQDRMKLVNFDKIMGLYVDFYNSEDSLENNNCWLIRIERLEDSFVSDTLGEYKTEDRAKEVLEDISRFILDFSVSLYVMPED